MKTRYKIIISNKNLYKEIELSPEADYAKIGTEIDCDFRLHRDLFFEPVSITLNRKDDRWFMICSDNLYISTGDVRKLITKELKHGDNISIRYQNSNNELFNLGFDIDFNDGNIKYERAFDISASSTITIGTDNTSNIVIRSAYTNNDNIVLKRNGSSFVLSIKNTFNGVYHNGKLAKNGEKIENGDFLSISDCFFYLKDNKLWTEEGSLVASSSIRYVDNRDKNTYPKFERNTRIKTVINEDDIEVLDPPAKPQKPKNSIITRLLPSVGMMLAAGAMAFMGGTMIIMSLISGSMAIVTSIITLIESKKEFKKNSEDRIVKYNNYIEKKTNEVKLLRSEERDTLDSIYLPQNVLAEEFEEFSPKLFDRSTNDVDYLCVKLGDGKVEAKRKIKYKKQERLEIEDDLQLLPEKMFNDFKYINEAPVVCNLSQINALSIVGNSEKRYELFKNIIFDIIGRQYYSDVRMALIAEPENSDRILWLRFLPQLLVENSDLRMLVTDNESKNIVFEHLYKELTIREQKKGYDYNIVAFFFDEFGVMSHPLSKFIEKGKDLGVTFVFFSSALSNVPKNCDYVVQLSDGGNSGNLIDTSNLDNNQYFEYAPIGDDLIHSVVNLLAPVYSEEISLEGSLTKSISMFEMLNILSVEDIDLQKRWDNSKVFQSMAAPIGVTKNGIVYLDLHDKHHGPHGLVAGTTGSGKSEVLQTYILSISTLFHPYEVAFVIIDFKGGGMVNQFKNLPHLLGAITNIDGKEINRSLKSIKAELQKRQRLFSELDVNHIDKYIKKYKAGEATVPIPHLVLIVDEFAELKAEQPEFMKELISAARIGRSLGVHLILATQKPSGQVNEQIWSNSKFKLCLKVQSQEDSNEVIKSPLAAEIKEPGRAYLQVGNNEIFELFQSAYSGAPEKIDDTVDKEFTIKSVSVCGKRSPVYIQKRRKTDGANITQLDAIVSYVSKYCKSHNLTRLPNICLPPLEDYLTIPEAINDYELNKLPLGIYDDPDMQYQGYGFFDLCNENTMIIGASQTGKTNLIQTIIRLVATKCSPSEAVFYIADFGAMYLKNFDALNHVGGVVTISENEKFKNLFKLLTEEIQFRKNKFLGCGLSSYSAYCEAGFTDLPHIFFIIDNFSAFKEVYAEAYEDQFIYLTREGISCGISIIVANSSTNGLGYRYVSNFATRIALKCNDSNEYITIFDRCRIQPKDVPGRSLCKLNKEIYEMQTFIAFEGEKEIERSNRVKEFISTINELYPKEKARQIPSVPEKLTFDYIQNNFNVNIKNYNYPIALDYANVDVVTLDLKAVNEFCIIGKETAKKLSVINSILDCIHRNILDMSAQIYIIDSVERPLKSRAKNSYIEKYSIDYSEIGSIFDNIMPELEERHNALMAGDFETLTKLPVILIIINNKDAIEYISSSKELLNVYLKLVKQYKSLGISFIFSDIDDSPVGYSGPELLKRFKEQKKGIITSKLSEFKFCEIPSVAIRANKTVNTGDVFMLDGSEISRIKLAKEEK